jgi:hypothetical protein
LSALVIWLNIPLAALAFGLMTGVPLWMVLRRPDRNPAETRSVPDYVTRPVGTVSPVVGTNRRLRPARVLVPSIQQ